MDIIKKGASFNEAPLTLSPARCHISIVQYNICYVPAGDYYVKNNAKTVSL